ncbi:predicted protein [Histoplasma capsulatum var. duboisii H88]|uniref:Predicted protein n=1 Tax=Ajellomyces capsulatus (strain H88) TaxID=544711 RepID=F0USK8_AJEC8|nr:predicted protein [Histoplasma capsulatum var. duboisii H88]
MPGRKFIRLKSGTRMIPEGWAITAQHVTPLPAFKLQYSQVTTVMVKVHVQFYTFNHYLKPLYKSLSPSIQAGVPNVL